MKRLFKVRDARGKQVGPYYEDKQKAKGARDELQVLPEHPLFVSKGPDHIRYKGGAK